MAGVDGKDEAGTIFIVVDAGTKVGDWFIVIDVGCRLTRWWYGLVVWFLASFDKEAGDGGIGEKAGEFVGCGWSGGAWRIGFWS